MTKLRLALYQPDIPQNTGTLLRLGACLGVGVDIIEPCGFVWDDKKLHRAVMDYINLIDYQRHTSWQAFEKNLTGQRLVLLSTQAAVPYTDFAFQDGDILLLGRESAGVPPAVHERAEARVLIPMASGARSINVALSGAIVLGEALRQLRAKDQPANLS